MFSVPERYLRCYPDVTCTARQIVRYGDYVLPDSWRHPNQPKLNNRQLVHTSPYFGELSRPHQTERDPRSLTVPTTTWTRNCRATSVTSPPMSCRGSGLGKRCRDADPSSRLLLRVLTGCQRAIPGFQQTILRALDMPVDDAVVIGPREASRSRRLYGPTPQLENPHYVDPAIGEVWAELGRWAAARQTRDQPTRSSCPAGRARSGTASRRLRSRRSSPRTDSR